MRLIIRKIKKWLGLYDLRTEGAKWVKENLGAEYVDEFLKKYDNINRGIPIGGLYETAVFIDICFYRYYRNNKGADMKSLEVAIMGG